MLFFLGCQQVDRKDDRQNRIETTSNVESIERVREMYHRFPSPEEMLSIINKNKSEYQSHLINSARKSDKYLDSKSQALNLGVYSADLAYLSIHGQHAESMTYFEALYELSDKLRISAAFNRAFLRRIQENIANADSLKVLSELAFNNLSNYLETNRNEKVFVLISFGGFIEALYLSINLTSDFDINSDLIQKIADQKYVLENIVAYSNNYASDKAVQAVLDETKPLLEIYQSLAIEVEQTEVSNTNDGKLVIGGGEKLLINEQQFEQLKEVVYALRNNIVEF